MRNRALDDRHFYQMLFRVINSFGDGIRDFVGFAQSITHHAIPIADDHNSRETEPSSAFHHFGNALNGNDLFLQVDLAGFYRADVTLCHESLKILNLPLWRPRPKL